VLGPSNSDVTISCPDLVTLGGLIYFTDVENLTSIRFPVLESLDSFGITLRSNPALVTISFPLLRTTADITISDQDNLVNVDFRSLVSTTFGIILNNLASLKLVAFPSLQFSPSGITFDNLGSVQDLRHSLPALNRTDTISVKNMDILRRLPSRDAYAASTTQGLSNLPHVCCSEIVDAGVSPECAAVHPQGDPCLIYGMPFLCGGTVCDDGLACSTETCVDGACVSTLDSCCAIELDLAGVWFSSLTRLLLI
jgi:hypothetical protein